MKQGMARFSGYLVPLCSLLALPVACSSESTPTNTPPPPPPGASGSGNSTAGTGGTGGSSLGGSSGSGGGQSGGSGGGTACMKATDCPGTGFACKNNVCACSVDVPDICGTGADVACVDKQTDEKNCGECGKACDAGAACAAGVCSAAPAELTKSTGCGNMRLAIQGANIYWTEEMSGKVRSMPLAGGPVVDIVTTGQVAPGPIVADATGIYWVNFGDGTAGSSKVMKVALPAAAGATPVVLKASTTTDKIYDVAVQGGKLYYPLLNSIHEISTDAAVTTDTVIGIAVNYDPPTPKIDGIPHGIAVNATMVAWADVGERNGVETDDLLPEGADPLTDKTGYHELAQSVGSISNQIGIDATYAYWCDGARFVRNKVDAAMPIPDPPIAEAPGIVASFAINATDVYLLSVDGTVAKHALAPAADGSTTTTPIAIDQMVTDVEHGVDGGIVLDGTKVYWATSDCAIRSSAL
jgi:hypothetical protein